MAKTTEKSKKMSEAPASAVSLRPLMGYILIEPDQAESKTASGLYLPETVQERPAQGKVISIGEDMILENGKIMKSPVKPGDKVVYKKWGGDEIKHEGKEYKLVKFDDLMAILE